MSMTLFSRRFFLGILGAAVAALVPAGAWAQSALAVGNAVPDWHATDLSGHAISGEALKGKVVVVDFWATWCGPCVSEIPGYIELQKKYGDQGFVIVGLSIDQAGPDVVKKFVATHKMNYRIAMADDDVLNAFGGDIEVIPTTFVIDRRGHLAYRKVGAMPEDQFEAIVKPLVEKR